MPDRRRAPFLPLALVLVALLLALAAPCALAETPPPAGSSAPSQAPSQASARLRELAERISADQNATAEEQAASRSLTSLLSGSSPGSEATGKAALALTEAALGQGRTETATSLAEAVLDIVADNSSGSWGVLAGRAKTLLSVAASVQAAYAASSPATTPTLPYVNSEAFDRKLSASLAERPPVFETPCPLPVSMKKLPERLDRWLSAIEKTGGTVEAVPVPEARGLFSDLLDLALRLYDMVVGRNLYEPAKFYNATVRYKRSTATVVTVVFTLR